MRVAFGDVGREEGGFGVDPEVTSIVARALQDATAELGSELVAVVAPHRNGVLVNVWVGETTAVSCPPLAALRPAAAVGADSMLDLHTHMRSAPPSRADQAVTRRMRAAYALLGIGFSGHVVVESAGVHRCDGSDAGGPGRSSDVP